MKCVQIIIFAVAVSFLAACGFSHTPARHVRKDPVPLYYMTVEQMLPDKPLEQQLAVAAQRGNLKKMDALVAAGADVNAKGAYGVTVPHWVLMHPNYKGFVHLLELGADPGIFSDNGTTLLHFAVELSPRIGVKYLKVILDSGKVDPNIEHPDNRRPIEFAINIHSREAFVMLVNAGAEYDYLTPGNIPFVVQVVDSNDFELAFYLLDKGVSYSSTTNWGYGIKRSFEVTFERQPWIYAPSSSRYMWFWRCVDFLEKHGMEFTIPADAQRPAVLDTRPPNISASPPRKAPLTQTAMMHEVALTYPTPAWAQTVATMGDVQERSLTKPGVILYEFVPKGESFSQWTRKMQVVAAYSDDALDAYTHSTLETIRRFIPGASHSTVIEQEDDHQLTYVQGTSVSSLEAYVYTGKYKNTLVLVTHMWDPEHTADAAAYRNYVLRNMHKIAMKKGFTVAPLD